MTPEERARRQYEEKFKDHTGCTYRCGPQICIDAAVEKCIEQF